MSKKAKKTFLAIGPTLIATGVTRLAQGSLYQGASLILVGTGVILAYDILDDKLKEKPTLPEGIDTEFLKELSIEAGNKAKEEVEEFKKK